MGLPLRLGEALCIFYSCYGFCKFGPGCKFDHLIDISKYNFSSSSSGTASLSCHQKNLMMQAKAGQLSLWESRQMPSGDDNIDTVKWRHKSFTFYGLLGLRKSSVNSFLIAGDVPCLYQVNSVLKMQISWQTWISWISYCCIV